MKRFKSSFWRVGRGEFSTSKKNQTQRLIFIHPNTFRPNTIHLAAIMGRASSPGLIRIRKAEISRAAGNRRRAALHCGRQNSEESVARTDRRANCARDCRLKSCSRQQLSAKSSVPRQTRRRRSLRENTGPANMRFFISTIQKTVIGRMRRDGERRVQQLRGHLQGRIDEAPREIR